MNRSVCLLVLQRTRRVRVPSHIHVRRVGLLLSVRAHEHEEGARVRVRAKVRVTPGGTPKDTRAGV